MNPEERLKDQLEILSQKGALRVLKNNTGMADFCSNDYLGLARSFELKKIIAEKYKSVMMSGATGSRLLSGNHNIMEELEAHLCKFHEVESALLFNSGYDANLSLLSSVPTRADIIIYDSLVHASIHDGMRMGKAEKEAFRHNDIEHLKELLQKYSDFKGNIFVVTESLFSMDGDLAKLAEISSLCENFGAALIVDEAHATGVIGQNGEGLVQKLRLEQNVFARMHTFGKALGGHGAVILGSKVLRDYLINYARPLIFSTAMPLHSVIHIIESYNYLEKNGKNLRSQLVNNINLYKQLASESDFQDIILKSETAIQGIIIPGNENVTSVASALQENNLDIRPIRYPTVEKGKERMRICLHSFNTEKEINMLFQIMKMSNFLKV